MVFPYPKGFHNNKVEVERLFGCFLDCNHTKSCSVVCLVVHKNDHFNVHIAHQIINLMLTSEKNEQFKNESFW
jgi:hypothetical protein